MIFLIFTNFKTQQKILYDIWYNIYRYIPNKKLGSYDSRYIIYL